ncbi:hypothetical protein SDC9_171879 [bioreactor metagenome]|uniref:Uncharacterized protein n=1 Tax=bioreactor metagenome TaxID=1076179 RepID=A0A645GEG2_9ZZZZ
MVLLFRYFIFRQIRTIEQTDYRQIIHTACVRTDDVRCISYSVSVSVLTFIITPVVSYFGTVPDVKIFIFNVNRVVKVVVVNKVSITSINHDAHVRVV